MFERIAARLTRSAAAAAALTREERAQGTTEYAILVGVLVVIAIIAIIAFRDKISSLWDAISSGINSL
ncbi:MAG: class III signal peptide-containing protein [Coriobacteriaceae bacterium]|nr:class III signal peptide-containing protein [Coriobacteriaceae bacterium]